MKISTEIGSLSSLVGMHKAVEMVAKAGFDHWDFTLGAIAPSFNYTTKQFTYHPHPLNQDNYLSYVRELKQIGLDNGITCNQAHAPYPTSFREVRELLPRSIECAAEAGADVIVVHPDNYGTIEENAAFYRELLPCAKSFGIRIAAENMWDWDIPAKHAIFAACSTPEDFCGVIDTVGDPFLGACLDIGHAEMMQDLTNALELVKALGKRIIALHIHDNNRRQDNHFLPGDGNIDYPPIISALRETGFDGVFTLEANSYPCDFKPEQAQTVADNMAKAARRLADMF